MTTEQIVGLCFIALPFICLFIFIWGMDSLKLAILIFGCIIAAMANILFGLYLLK